MNFYQTLTHDHLIAAHRGYRALRPENTLSAFTEAMGHFDFIELDIQPSRDGRLMVLHDETIERTTDADDRLPSPRPHHLFEYDYSQLHTLDAASWFVRSDPFGTLASGMVSPQSIAPEPIPTLDEVLRLCARHAMPLNIEIKDSPAFDTDALLQELLTTIAPYREGAIPLLISSFNHRYLAQLHTLDPTLSLAANIEHTHPPQLLQYLEALGVIAYHVDAPLTETTPVAQLAEAGITCGVFTLNDPQAQAQCFKKGFRAIFADMPPKIHPILQTSNQ